MSSYYEYQGVGVMIAHKLMKIDGWKVYGYHADESDSMTDYYSPAYWNGVAEKNGYILCVNVHGAREAEEIRKYNYTSFSYNKDIDEKIQKLKEITVERGACEEDERCAKVAILKLQKKAEGETENKEKYAVVGVIPGHLANPPRCNWHIEKDGIIIAKGNGLLKYAAVDDYYRYDRCFEDLNQWKADEEKYIANFIRDNMHRWNDTEERSRECALSHIAQLKKDDAIIQQFEAFINKIDTACGGLIGEGDSVVYEKIKVTEYRNETKAVETTNGSIKEGQLFIVKTSFNHGHSKGFVYRIHATEYHGKITYHAYKLNGKLTKECTGSANAANYWYITDNFIRWFEKGSLAWCELQEVKTPYEVEKVVKKTIKAENKSTQKTSTEPAEETRVETRADIDNLTFKVSEDTDTRTNEKIYLAKVTEKLSREDYIKVNKYINSLGGYYSKFKHAFLFREDPTAILKTGSIKTESAVDDGLVDAQAESIKVNYIITEDIHTKTGEKLYLVKPDKELSRNDFTELKRKFATIQGYYSSFKKVFIFKYDPTEKLGIA